MYLLSQILMANKPAYIKILPDYDVMANNCEKTCTLDVRFKQMYGCSKIIEYMRLRKIPCEITSRKSVDCDPKINCCFVYDNCKIQINDKRYTNDKMCSKLLNEIANSHSHIIE